VSHHRTITRRGLMLAGAAGPLILQTARARAQQPAEKLGQADAAYQATPKNGQQCSECTKFQPPQACSVVSGSISPKGWCKLYEAPPE
jgi:hypothetical protein